MHNAVQQIGQQDIMPVDLVEFSSVGRILIIGNNEQIEQILPHITNLQITTSLNAPTDISGWLGEFKVNVDGEVISVDLVLDLQEQVSMTVEVLPLGYFAPRGDAQVLAEALQQLPEMIGTFDKPRYFNYKSEICAHSRRQLQGCSQCIDACPAEAITSIGEQVSVNPSLCQGCGSCTSVCPSGAMSYALPSLDVSINRLRAMMQAYFELEQDAPQIVIHDLEKGQQLVELMGEKLADTIITFSIEEIGALGMPFWLTALCYGASNLTIWNAGTHTDHSWNEVQKEIVKTNEMLAGIGYGDNKVNWCESGNITDLISSLNVKNDCKIKPAVFAGVDDKRRMIRIAMEYLHKQAPAPVELLALSSQAAFGEIKVDTKGCTLCHSCVSVCPAGAVLDGGEQPQLNFIEDRCVQCGLCETACPEDVISLVPQYLFDQEQARKIRLLHEEPIFNCISCNKGFATQKMIDTMTGKLKGHPMFQGDALERLKMCEDCRVKAMFKEKGTF